MLGAAPLSEVFIFKTFIDYCIEMLTNVLLRHPFVPLWIMCLLWGSSHRKSQRSETVGVAFHLKSQSVFVRGSQWSWLFVYSYSVLFFFFFYFYYEFITSSAVDVMRRGRTASWLAGLTVNRVLLGQSTWDAKWDAWYSSL